MIRERKVMLLAASTILSVGLAVVVNVATGGSFPGPLGRLHWLAWPLVGALAAAVTTVAVWQADGDGDAGPRPPVRPAELPPDTVRFVGRHDDLAPLAGAVPERPATGLGAPVVLGVFGAGGMGKTVLATRLAHMVAPRYPDGQVFVELRGASPDPADPPEVLRRVLHGLGVAAADVPEDAAARQALYRSVLVDRRVLLYLDDAGGEAQVRPLLPSGRGCLVLITARPSLAGLGVTAWRNLDVLPDDEAAALLGEIAGAPDRLHADPDAVAEVVRLCGGLPLALAIAAARLRHRPQWTVADLARRLADERRRLDELHAGNLDVRTSIGLSYADLDPLSARLFRLLSLVEHADFGPGVGGALLGGRDAWIPAEAALERLADAKLVEIAGPRRYRFHDLVRLYAREQLEAEEPPAERRDALRRSLQYYLERTQELWADLADASAGADRHGAADAWFDRTRSAVVAAVTRAAEAGQPETAWRLAAAVAPYLESRGYPVDLAVVSDTAVSAARAAGDRSALAVALRDLGQAERHRSRHDRALAAFAESLALHEALGHDGAAAEVLHRIGDCHRASGRLHDAEDAYVRAIALFHRLGQSRDEALVQAQLALTWLLEGQVTQAMGLIEGTAERLGVADPDVTPDPAGAWALEILGAARLASGSPGEAEQCHLRSLASFRSRGERYGAAHALLNLGRCAAALGRSDDARGRYEESLRSFTEMGNVDGQAEAGAGLAALPRPAPAARRRSHR